MTIFVLFASAMGLLFAGIIPAVFLASDALIAAGPSIWFAVSLIALVGAVLAASVLHKAGAVA